jgi:hypothetical protein
MIAVLAAVAVVVVVHELMRQVHRLLPKGGRLERAFLAVGPFAALALGVAALALFPKAAPAELAAAGLSLLWGALLGALSSGGHELKKIALGALMKGAGRVFGEAPAADAPPLPATSPASELEAPRE